VRPSAPAAAEEPNPDTVLLARLKGAATKVLDRRCFNADLGEDAPTCDFDADPGVAGFRESFAGALRGLHRYLGAAPELAPRVRIELRVVADGKADAIPFAGLTPRAARMVERYEQLARKHGQRVEPVTVSTLNKALACARALTLLDAFTGEVAKPLEELRQAGPLGHYEVEVTCNPEPGVGGNLRGASLHAELKIVVKPALAGAVAVLLKNAGWELVAPGGAQAGKRRRRL